ncbi:hypothetical protein ACHAWF_011749 [Thalassiosira exigua]
METSRSRALGGGPDAHEFDQFLKKLETTKQVTSFSPAVESRQRADSIHSTDNSSFDSRTEDLFVAEFDEFEEGQGQNDFDNNGNDHQNERQPFDTPQTFREPHVESPVHRESVYSFIERTSGSLSSHDNLPDKNSSTSFFEEGLPDAILKLDRRHAIPAPRHKNDILVEIEASTVDRRDCMVRPGVRCAESLPQGVETIGMDCIGRVVQVTTYVRAVYGISIDDRVAAIYPFDYKSGCKDKGQRNKRYALVDAGFVVSVPKHVDAADAACMIRLYMSAFQSIRLGLGFLYDRYDSNQLKGQSILVQNGQTELGRAIIDLTRSLGATQIFATAPTEDHPLLMAMDAVPLGSETFSWELFLEEKISLVLVQEMPTSENFAQFISILDENRGNMVYIHPEHKCERDDLGITTDDVSCDISCDTSHVQDLVKKAKASLKAAKFSIVLACSPQFSVYEGVWPSCKGNRCQFKEDLRYLFTLLGQDALKPNVNECIGLEEVADVQDRIELLGKKGTIVCLPTALYEKKAYIVEKKTTAAENPIRGDPQGYRVGESKFNQSEPDYASDAGYVKATQEFDPSYPTLSDFHRMNEAEKSPPEVHENTLMPALPETMAAVSPKSRMRTSFGVHHHSFLLGSVSDSKSESSSNSSSGNMSACRSPASDGAIKTTKPPRAATKPSREDPPRSIEFCSSQSRQGRASQRQRRAKERWKRSHQQKKNTEEKEKQDMMDQKLVSSHTRRTRREARKKQARSQADENPSTHMVIKTTDAVKQMPSNKDRSSASILNTVEDETVASYENATDIMRIEAREPNEGNAARAPMDENNSFSHGELIYGDLSKIQVLVKGEGSSEALVPSDEEAKSEMERVSRQTTTPVDPPIKDNTMMRTAIRRPDPASKATPPPKMDRGPKDSRNEEESERNRSSGESSFNKLMSKWKNIDDRNHPH